MITTQDLVHELDLTCWNEPI